MTMRCMTRPDDCQFLQVIVLDFNYYCSIYYLSAFLFWYLFMILVFRIVQRCNSLFAHHLPAEERRWWWRDDVFIVFIHVSEASAFLT